MSSVATDDRLAVEPDVLRRTMGRFTTGVAIVLADGADGPSGMTINSLTWISHEPPLILVSLTTDARTAQAVAASGRCSVSILGISQERIASHFAKRGEDRFAELEIVRGQSGVPIVPGALAHMECAIEQEIEVADHTLFIARVEHAQHRPGEPLAFHSGKFGAYLPEGSSPLDWA